MEALSTSTVAFCRAHDWICGFWGRPRTWNPGLDPTGLRPVRAPHVRIQLFGAAAQRLRPSIFLRELGFWDPQIQFFGPLRGILKENLALPARGGKPREKGSYFFRQKSGANAVWPASFPTAFPYTTLGKSLTRVTNDETKPRTVFGLLP